MNDSEDPDAQTPSRDVAPGSEQGGLFVPWAWDRRIPPVHRILSISLGVLAPFLALVATAPEGRDAFLPLVFLVLVVIAVPYRASFSLLSSLAVLICQNRLLDGSVLALGICLMVVGRLQRLPFWVNAYVVRYVVIVLSFWCLTRIGSMY